MIQLSNIVTHIKEINPAWTFSHYCGIPMDQFNGSPIKITSIFKPDEKTPSFCIYYEKDKVKFKCFATGHGGDHINLVQAKEKLNYSDTCFKIMNDYTQWAINANNPVPGKIIVKPKFKVTGYKIRSWSVADKDFFLP